MIGVGKRENLYEISFVLNRSESLNVIGNKKDDEYMKWDKRFGHINFDSLNTLIKTDIVGLTCKCRKSTIGQK